MIAAQWSRQKVVPEGHAPHVPLLQDCPVGHAFPQAPQFMGSLLRKTQWSRQKVCPDGHAPHVPLLQDCPAEQAFPHVPQFVGSPASEVQ